MQTQRPPYFARSKVSVLEQLQNSNQIPDLMFVNVCVSPQQGWNGAEEELLDEIKHGINLDSANNSDDDVTFDLDTLLSVHRPCRRKCP